MPRFIPDNPYGESISMELTDEQFRIIAESINNQAKVSYLTDKESVEHFAVLEIDESWCEIEDMVHLYKTYELLRENILPFCWKKDSYTPIIENEDDDEQFMFARMHSNKLYAIVDANQIASCEFNILAMFTTEFANRDLFTPVLKINKFVPISPMFCAFNKNKILNAITLFALETTLRNPVKYVDVTIPITSADKVSLPEPLTDILGNEGYKISQFTLVKDVDNHCEDCISYNYADKNWVITDEGNRQIYLFRLNDVLLNHESVDNDLPIIEAMLGGTFPQIINRIREGASDIELASEIRYLLNKYNLSGLVVYSSNKELDCVVLYRVMDNSPLELVDVLSPVKNKGENLDRVLTILNLLARATENIIPMWFKSINPSNKLLPKYTGIGFEATMKSFTRAIDRSDYSKFVELVNTDATCQ